MPGSGAGDKYVFPLLTVAVAFMCAPHDCRSHRHRLQPHVCCGYACVNWEPSGGFKAVLNVPSPLLNIQLVPCGRSEVCVGVTVASA